MKGPIFIVGPMGSGTTLLRLMLDSHEHIAIPHETGFMRVYNAMHFTPFKWSGKHWAYRLGWSFHEVDEQARGYFETLFRRYADEHGAQRWGEKTPHHTWHVAAMKRLFPDSVFIGIVRHPGATVASNMRRFGHTKGWATVHVRRYMRELARLGGMYQQRFVLLRYEDLVMRPEQTMRELLEWLGEPWSDSVLKHHEVQSTRGRRIEGQTEAQALDATRVATWVEQLTPGEKSLLAKRTKGIGRFFGYSLSDPERLEQISAHGTVLFGGQEVRDRIAQFEYLDLNTQGDIPVFERHYHPHELLLTENPYGRPRFVPGERDAARGKRPNAVRRAIFETVGRTPWPIRKRIRAVSGKVRRRRKERARRVAGIARVEE